jgi:hypothetical protein
MNLCLLLVAAASSAVAPSRLLNHTFHFWNTYRDPYNGLYCDNIRFDIPERCGEVTNRRYSSAAVGMGLVADCVFAEIGLLPREDAQTRALQTLKTLRSGDWPTEKFSGFFVHWTCGDRDSKLRGCGEYSTVDTAEMAMGALFAGNFFGGEVQRLAQALSRSVSWSNAIKAADSPTIFPVVDKDSGKMSGNIRPFNEYYIVAYIAQLMEGAQIRDGHNNTAPADKAARYFDTYFGHSGPPAGHGGYPVHLKYDGIDLLTDNPNRFMSSFIPQFCWFLCKGFHTNEVDGNTHIYTALYTC